MKKILVLLVTFVLLNSAAFAAQDDGKGGEGTPQPVLISAGQGEAVPEGATTQEEKGNQNRQMIQSGLENALSHVTNEMQKGSFSRTWQSS